jgi:hypothetical protein
MPAFPPKIEFFFLGIWIGQSLKRKIEASKKLNPAPALVARARRAYLAIMPYRDIEKKRARDRARWHARDLTRKRDARRRANAVKRGHVPPPPEKDCPPRPADGRCQYCPKVLGDPLKLVMDHNHKTGAFCAWCCRRCNIKINDRMGDFGEIVWPGSKRGRS